MPKVVYPSKPLFFLIFLRISSRWYIIRIEREKPTLAAIPLEMLVLMILISLPIITYVEKRNTGVVKSYNELP